jgi:predicted nuclease of predicted toxin-antitoxin system
MKLLVDECCDALLVNALRKESHDILYIMENYRGADDKTLFQIASTENRIIVTEDKDFGELTYRLKLTSEGIILLRFDISERENKIPRLIELIKNQNLNLLGSFTILENNKIRIRPLSK